MNLDLIKGAIQRIEESRLDEIVVTNTISKKHKSHKIKELCIAKLFSDTIKSVMQKRSISSNFIC